MSLSFSPRQTKEIPLDGFSADHFLIAALISAHQLGWEIGQKSKNGFVAYSKISMSSFGEEIKLQIGETAATIQSGCLGTQIIDWGKNKENIDKFCRTLSLVKQSLTEEMLIEEIEKLELADLDEKLQEENKTTVRSSFAAIFSLFKPTQGYFITPLLIDLNILIFLIMSVSGVNVIIPSGDDLLQWGANLRPMTMDGQWWRLITSTFIHIGIIHLLMNMYALLYIGLLLEPYVGKIRFLFIYLTTGFLASLTSLGWNELTISAGASGAIFGMYGVFIALLTTNIIDKGARKALLVSILIFVLYNLLNGLKGGIDNAAHIGGLVSGIILGYTFIPSIKKSDDPILESALIGIVIFGIAIGSAFFIRNIRPYEIKEYDKGMQEFATWEKMALGFYQLPPDTPRSRMLYEVGTNSVYYWQVNEKLINELDRLYLPQAVHERNQKLLNYCQLRIQFCRVLYKAIDEETNTYGTLIDELNQKIEASLNDLTGEKAGNENSNHK